MINFLKKGDKLLTDFLVIILLIFIWISVSFYNTPDPYFFILTYTNNKTDYIQVSKKEVLAKEQVNGRLLARENYLGTIAVRFNTYNRINDDYIVFRIKEKGRSNWYYENKYKVDQFQPEKHFTFGFPIINNSKNKEYIFLLESVKGKKKNAVAISTKEPIFVTKYLYPKSTISNVSGFIIFLGKKIINIFQNTNLLLSIMYVFPILLYILFRLSSKNYSVVSNVFSLIFVGLILWNYFQINSMQGFLNQVYILVAVIIIFSILPIWLKIVPDKNVYIASFLSILFLISLIWDFMLIERYALSVLLMLSLWGLLVIRYRLDRTFTFMLVIIFLIFCCISLIFKVNAYADKFAILAFYFIFLGLAHSIYDEFFINKKQLSTVKLISELLKFYKSRI